jgi:hypothetical protein
MGPKLIPCMVLMALLWPRMQPAERKPSVLLPAASEIQPWSARDQGRQYRDQELFDYMDGGADIYLEFGFARVLVQEYVLGPHVIELEIYQMRDAAAAFGMYSIKKGSGGKQLEIGREGLLSDSYLNFWKGTFLVTLVGMDSSEETLSGLKTIALAVSPKLSPDGMPPPLLSLLIPENRIESSLRYFRGDLGFRNIQKIIPPSVLKFTEGVGADYRSASGEWSEYLIRFDSDKLARAGFEALQTRFRSNPRYSYSPESGGIRVKNRETETILFLIPEGSDLILFGNVPKEDIPGLVSRQRRILADSR